MVLKRFNLTVMKKITVLSGLLLLAGLAAQAQERVAEYNVRPAVTVRTPLQGDSINFKGDKFTTGNLLKTKVSLDFDGGRYERMVADTAGYVTVAKADKDNLFYLFATNLRAERFMKGKLNVYSPARFEVFVNGESKQVKETAEDSLSQVRPTAVSLRMDPEADYEIVIKLLSSADDKMQPMLKCEFEKERICRCSLPDGTGHEETFLFVQHQFRLPSEQGFSFAQRQVSADPLFGQLRREAFQDPL